MRHNVIPFILALVATGCSQIPQSALPNSTNFPSHLFSAASSYKSLYSFKGGSDGASPEATLVGVNGALYGTTNGRDVASDFGTIFEVQVDGQERVLHRFQNGKDGAYPLGSLLAVNGALYGTTNAGGTASGFGTIFEENVDGSGYKVLHRFSGTTGRDGAGPAGGLLAVSGVLYGTTQSGGANGYGTVFKLGENGAAYKTLYSFSNPYQTKDGADPEGSLIAVGSILYGVTYAGGSGCYNPPLPGCGTVFSVTASGKEKVLYRFGRNGASDGANPAAGLLYVAGTLYGTTSQNANATCFENTGCGTVFAVSPAGKERIIHRFGTTGTARGATPEAALTAMSGVLYGTTFGGGTGGPGGGNGTVFGMSALGSQDVLYSFGGPSVSDGAEPNGLVALGGALYGTAQIGGSGGCPSGNGCGTVFLVTP
jgi:uncharacterized repeat protein (TIGR03803 family)